MSEQRGPHVRIRTAVERKKALAQLQELRVAGKVARALVIVEKTNGDFEVLGQEMKPFEVGRALLAATMALQHADEQRTAVKPEPHEMPASWEDMFAKPRDPEIKRDKDGTFLPPEGENFISCGECHHPRWYVLHHNDENRLSRYACAHCGNEVKSIPIYHPEGSA